MEVKWDTRMRVQKGAGIKTNFYLKILPKQTLPKEETV